jgi:hypothetical protein
MMKTYNRALDFMALAAVQFQQGRVKTAAKLMAKCIASSDFDRAIAIVESSNDEAFQLKAAAKAQAVAVAAKKRKTLAAEDQALESLVGDIDELEDDTDVVDEEADEDEEEVDAEFEADEGEPEEVEEEESGPEENFATALAALKKKPAVAAKKKPALAPKRK